MNSTNQNSKKVLVTGAAGQLGTAICRLLRESLVPFLAVDKNPSNQNEFSIRKFDLLKDKRISKLFDGISVLIHLANHPNWFTGSPEKVYIENAAINMSIFQAAANTNCKRVVFASSIQVLNGQKPNHNRSEQEILLPYIPMDSEMPAIPKNNYALSKLAAENMLKYFAETRGMTCISLRYPWLVNLEGLKKAVEEGGIRRENCYDGFAYLPLHSAAELAIKSTKVKLNGYHEYFVASKDNIAQRKVSDIIQRELSHVPCKKPVEEMDSLVDCSKVEKELGWSQPRSLMESYEKYQNLEINRNLKT